jgi:hypothetical protein
MLRIMEKDDGTKWIRWHHFSGSARRRTPGVGFRVEGIT